MTLDECTALLAPFALALRAEVDGPTFRAYHQYLADVPATLFEATLFEASQRGVRFLPSASELRQMGEAVRRQAIAKRPYRPCEACGHSGWVEHQEADDVARYARCACWRAYQARLAAAGLAVPLALEAGQDDSGEEPAVEPLTLHRLHPSVREAIQGWRGLLKGM